MAGTLLASALLRERLLRQRYVDPRFADGCSWWMLLDLYRAQPQSVSSLCFGSGFPYTTALRHLKQLTDAGLVERLDHDSDGRQVICCLSEGARDGLGDYLTTVEVARVESLAA